MTASAAPAVSVVVPTRNRGALASETIASLLRTTRQDIEVVLVDQSTNDETADAVGVFDADPRFRYVRTDTVGASTCRNVGVRSSTGALLLFTDDDCTVEPDWIDRMEAEFTADERLAAVYCAVVPAPYDPHTGYIPAFHPPARRLGRSIGDKRKVGGMSAGLGVRRRDLDAVGGFDETMGPGSRFRTGEDFDLEVRLLLQRRPVLVTPDIRLVHHGFRDIAGTRALSKIDWSAIGASLGKCLRAGQWPVLVVLAHELVSSVRKPVTDLVRLRPPRGLRQPIYLVSGLLAALRCGVDRRTLTFR